VIREQSIKSFGRAALSPDPDLALAALMIARLEYPGLDATPYLEQLDALGHEARIRVAAACASPCEAPEGVDPLQYARVMALNEYLFAELRFVGNSVRYEDPRNSCLNEVLDRRTGIPITLALLYIEVARRAGLEVQGINFPGHFLLRCSASLGRPYARDLIIDAFHGGALLSADACQELLRRHQDPEDAGEDDAAFGSRAFSRATKPQILARMLLNLKRIYERMHSFSQARDVTELLLAVDPWARGELRDRGLLAYHLKDFSSALRDLQAYLRLPAPAPLDDEEREHDEQIWEHVKTLRRRLATLN
jgi:regulator of sirC expression with transglutaminase-like and TPR domain